MQIRQVSTLEPGAVASFDSLPVFQLAVFPAPPGHDLPFAQARIYAERGRSLFLKLTSYEAVVPEDSRFSLAFGALKMELSPRRVCLSLHGEPLDSAAVRTTPISGEDLQGEFWGVIVQLPLAVLRTALPTLSMQPGEQIPFALSKSSESTGYCAALFNGDGALALSAF